MLIEQHPAALVLLWTKGLMFPSDASVLREGLGVL